MWKVFSKADGWCAEAVKMKTRGRQFQLTVTRYAVSTMVECVKQINATLIIFIIYFKNCVCTIDLTKESYFKVFVPYELKVLR